MIFSYSDEANLVMTRVQIFIPAKVAINCDQIAIALYCIIGVLYFKMNLLHQ